MKVIRLVILTIIAALALAPNAKAVERSAAAGSKPNILFILMDNLGYGELGVYGGGITRGAPTPRIDSLAAQGMRLLNMNMETQCTPSRSSIMTGRFSIRSGTYMVPLGGVPDGLTQWEATIAESLSDAGYATALYGKWHLGSHDGRLPNDQGFDEWFGIPRTTDESGMSETRSPGRPWTSSSRRASQALARPSVSRARTRRRRAAKRSSTLPSIWSSRPATAP